MIHVHGQWKEQHTNKKETPNDDDNNNNFMSTILQRDNVGKKTLNKREFSCLW